MKRNDIVAAAKSLVGVRFQHQGRKLEFGLDCGGVLVYLWQYFNLTDFDHVAYPARPPVNFVETLIVQSNTMRRKPLLEAKPGDVVVMGTPDNQVHIGVLTELRGRLAMVHADNRKGVVEHNIELKDKMIRNCFEFVGVED